MSVGDTVHWASVFKQMDYSNAKILVGTRLLWRYFFGLLLEMLQRRGETMANSMEVTG